MKGICPTVYFLILSEIIWFTNEFMKVLVLEVESLFAAAPGYGGEERAFLSNHSSVHVTLRGKNS